MRGILVGMQCRASASLKVTFTHVSEVNSPLLRVDINESRPEGNVDDSTIFGIKNILAMEVQLYFNWKEEEDSKLRTSRSKRVANEC